MDKGRGDRREDPVNHLPVDQLPVKQLIVNGDDFGYTRGVNRAILAAYRSGILTSTSLLANGAAFADAVERAQQEPSLDVGCHVNLVEGAPVLQASHLPHLVGADGKFCGAVRLGLKLLRGAVPAKEIERESIAQIEKLLRAGIAVSHLDTHQHTHLHPRVAGALGKAAQQFGIRWIRRPFENCPVPASPGTWLRKMAGLSLHCFASPFDRCLAARNLCAPDFFSGFVLTGRLTKQLLADILNALQPGVTELMCHPGHCDAELQSSPTRLKRNRETEFEAVADGSLRDQMRERGIVLTRFRDLPWEPGCRAQKPLVAVPAAAGGE